MAKNSKVKDIMVNTHDGNHFVTVTREFKDGSQKMFHSSTNFISIYSIQRVQRAQIALLPQAIPWRERPNAWRRAK